MTVFKLGKPLTANEKEAFQKEILQINYFRSRNLSFVLLAISIVMIALFDVPNSVKGFAILGPGYRELFYLHIVLGVSALCFLGFYWINKPYLLTRIRQRDKVFNLLFCLVLSFLSALLAVNDQLMHGEITLYILGLFTLVVINYFNLWTTLLIYLSSYAIFIVGITKFQPNYYILREHYVNSAIMLLLALFMSSVLYYGKIQEFISRKTIDTQNNQLEQANMELKTVNQALRESLDALDESQNMIVTLALALESKDDYTRGHSERVSEYAAALANDIGLDEDTKTDLWRASILHDVGKIGIPDAILTKPSKLTNEEFQIMKSHPERGERICSKLKFAQEILPIIRYHHERYDGSGYPDGLKGDEIPLLARIIAIADMIDAVTSERSYREAETLETALKELKKNAGTQFDPELAFAFIKMYAMRTA